MAKKNLTIRVDDVLYRRLQTLKKAVKVSVNDLGCDDVGQYVAERSALDPETLKVMAQRLRSYRDADPDLKKSLGSFADAEGRSQDPLEGVVVDTAKLPPHTKLQELLNG